MTRLPICQNLQQFLEHGLDPTALARSVREKIRKQNVFNQKVFAFLVYGCILKGLALIRDDDIANLG